MNNDNHFAETCLHDGTCRTWQSEPREDTGLRCSVLEIHKFREKRLLCKWNSVTKSAMKSYISQLKHRSLLCHVRFSLQIKTVSVTASNIFVTIETASITDSIVFFLSNVRTQVIISQLETKRCRSTRASACICLLRFAY